MMGRPNWGNNHFYSKTVLNCCKPSVPYYYNLKLHIVDNNDMNLIENIRVHSTLRNTFSIRNMIRIDRRFY